MQFKHLMIGMQNAGKSTFIAALYHVVESGQVKDSLQLVELGEMRKYVVDLRDQWLGCVKLERTKLGEEQVVTMKLKDRITERLTEIILPDVSGETFRDQWEQRKSTKLVDDLARQADGLLFFIHPEMIRNPVRINQNKQVAAVLDEEGENLTQDKSQPSETQNKQIVDWGPKFAPTAVKQVELLQFLLREPHIYPISCLALIISAWDLAKEDYSSPSSWLAEHLPLLNQFLKANSDRLPYKIFGISAQGKQYIKEEDDLHGNDELHGKKPQADRIEVITDISGEYGIRDITAPIKWLMKNKDQ